MSDQTEPRSSTVLILDDLGGLRGWLRTMAQDKTPRQIVPVRGLVVNVAQTIRDMDLHRDFQLDALEVLRLAEHALASAIHRGQVDGTIETLDEARVRATMAREVKAGRAEPSMLQALIKPKPLDFALESELWGSRGDGLMAFAAVSQADFEVALATAKAEGNLSRANVVREVQSRGGETPETRETRAGLIRELAAQNFSSRQMPAKVGVSEATVRRIARDYDIEIPADRTIAKTRRHDSNRIATETVSSLEGLAAGVRLIDYDAINPTDVQHWVTSLTESLRELNRFNKRLKEL